MSIDVLGISGSPIPDSNTDRAVRQVLFHSGMKSDFVKLSDLRIEPCRACLGCKETNECVVQDDGRELAQRFREAKAFVLACFTPYSSLDGRSKTFMERMYCLRHQTGLNQGKVGAAVITTACDPDNDQLPPAAATAASQIAFWMMAEGMVNAGSMVVMGNVPCIRCGFGDDCQLSGIKMLHGPEATVESVGVNRFEQETSQLEAAAQLGKKIREAVQATATPG